VIFATDDELLCHTTVRVKFFWEPSEYAPVALNCKFVPFAIDLLAGEIAIAVSAGGPFGAMLPPPQLTASTLHASTRRTPLARATGESFMAKTGDSGEG